MRGGPPASLCSLIALLFLCRTVAVEANAAEEVRKCLMNQDEMLKQEDRRQLRAKAEVVLQGADIKLDCFSTCLTEEELLDVGDAIKPSDNFPARKIASGIGVRRPNNKQWNFMWQSLLIFKNGTEKEKTTWKNVVDTTKKREQTAIDAMKSARIRRRFFFGDFFELEVHKATPRDTGWYRCTNTENVNNPLRNLYFIDVTSRLSITSMYFDNAESMEKFEKSLETPVFPRERMQIIWKTMRTTECNRCDYKGSDGQIQKGHGEIHKELVCHLRITDETAIEESSLAYMQLFGEIPCGSSMVPLSLRPAMRNLKAHVYELTRNCSMKCSKDGPKLRKIMGLDEHGETVEVDDLFPGEFEVHEHLPLLRRSVIRRVALVTVNSKFIGDCGIGKEAVYWTKNGELLTTKSHGIVSADRKLIIRAGGVLYIEGIIDDDEGSYACYTREGVLLATFHVILKDGKMSAELTDLLKIVLRVSASVLLFIVVVSVVQQTTLHAQWFEHHNAKQYYKKKGVEKEKKRTLLRGTGVPQPEGGVSQPKSSGNTQLGPTPPASSKDESTLVSTVEKSSAGVSTVEKSSAGVSTVEKSSALVSTVEKSSAGVSTVEKSSAKTETKSEGP
uniref:Ig-like domain-containing protein n=1 Tax=Steinernema glaseri TaxID=37863 RepID=A0A1I7ZRV6_9BILA